MRKTLEIGLKSCVAILAGGMGTRLQSRSGNLPKPMVPILGKPVLEHQIDLCRKHGFLDIALLVHYQYESIESYFGDGSKFGVRLTYVVENEARGTAGALCDGLKYLADEFLVMYADTFADVDLKAFWEAAVAENSSAVLLLHPNDHPHDSDLVEIDERGNVKAIHAYPHPEGADYRNLVNAALYFLRKDRLTQIIPPVGKSDIAKHTFVRMLDEGMRLRAYVTPEYIKDMGTPARLDKVEHDIRKGLPEKLSGRHRRRAVFLDRDGTLNVEVNHLKDPSQLKLLPTAGEAVHALNRAGVLAVGVTNQPVLARGDISWTGLANIHARLDRLLGEDRAYLDRIYVCPHHPDRGFEGEVPELKCVCACRKPATGLIDQAVMELGIDRASSWLVGDTTADLLAGKRAGLKTILVRTGYAGRDDKYEVDPDYVSDSLRDAVHWILAGHAAATAALMPIAHRYMRERLVLIGGPARAGKSTAAKVMQELFAMTGRTSHVVPLDAWLKPAALRHNDAGVLARYDIEKCFSELSQLRDVGERVEFKFNLWDRKDPMRFKEKRLSVGPEDIIIVEGVPALADALLLSLSDARIHIDAEDSVRLQRLRYEYVWRDVPEELAEEKIRTRETDEVLPVRAALSHAQYKLNLEEYDS